MSTSHVNMWHVPLKQGTTCINKFTCFLSSAFIQDQPEHMSIAVAWRLPNQAQPTEAAFLCSDRGPCLPHSPDSLPWVLPGKCMQRPFC
jgi:hypothetical protein